MTTLGLASAMAQVTLVKNLNPTYHNGIQSDTELFPFNNKVIFAGNESSSILNFELYESDGTNAGTRRIKDISPGNTPSYPRYYTIYPSTGEIFFSASGGVSTSNIELWKTDLTEAGTQKVSEFDTAGNGAPDNITPYNGKLIMRARSTNVGWELCQSSGTLASSTLLKDLYTGSISGIPSSGSPSEFIEFNGWLYFSANTILGYELWKTNGTAAGTVQVKDINPGGSSNPNNFVIMNNKLYFVAADGTNGREIWTTDGTSAGTFMVADVNVGGSSDPQHLTVRGGRIYFSAYSNTFGREMHYMNSAENVVFLRDCAPGILDGNPSNIFSYGSYVYFMAGDGTNGKELWKTDGSIIGTSMVKDINPSGSSFPNNFTVYNNKLYFTASDGSNGNEIWTTDGTNAGTQMITDIHTAGAGDSNPQSLVVVDDKLFFHAYGGTSLGRELYYYLDPNLSAEEFSSDAFSLYPNPGNNYFEIRSNQPVSKVEITDMNGRLIKTYESVSDVYDISDLSSGIYLVNVTRDSARAVRKLIKN